MKTIAKVLLGTVLVIGCGLLLTRNNSGEIAQIIDRLNPIVIEGEVYVKTVAPESVNEHGTAQYKQEAADQVGHKREVQFTGMSELKQDRYLKLKNKGSYVETYEEVAKEDVPEKALAVIG